MDNRHVCVEGAKGEYLYECACPCEASEKVSFCMYVSVCIYLHVCLHVCVGGRSMWINLPVCVWENMFLCICEEEYLCICLGCVSVKVACSRVNACVLSVLIWMWVGACVGLWLYEYNLCMSTVRMYWRNLHWTGTQAGWWGGHQGLTRLREGESSWVRISPFQG